MFGQSKPAFGTSAFGATSTGGGLFGQNKTVGFATTQSGGLFGSTAPTNTGGGLFGQQQTTSGGLFGSTGTSTFGTPASTGGGLFGSTGTATSAFGSTSTGGGLFGQTSQAPTGGGLFGASTTGGGGLFGASATAQSGTTVKFDPLVSQDTMMRNNTQTSIQTKHQCITAMKAYDTKSLEELRVEDYLANRKGAQAGSTSAFGAPAGGGLFGSTAAPASTGTSLFGSTAAKPLFGSTATTTTSGGMFGSSGTTGGGLFGAAAKPTTSGLFGSTATPFGAPASTSSTLFGAKPTPAFGSTATSGGLFGSTAPAGAFGQPAASTAFGQPATSTGGLFGAKPAFGAVTTTTGSTGLFGSAQPASTGLFGAKPATTPFGAPAPAGGLFGAPAASTAGAFGATQPGGLFGTTAQKPGGLFGSTAPATGGLFGAAQPATSAFGTSGGLFGTTAAKPLSFGATATPSTGLFGSGMGTTAAQQPTQLTLNPDNEARAAFQSQLEYLASAPYGDVLKPLKPLSTDAAKPTDPVAHSRIISASSQGGERMKGRGSLFDSPRGSSILRPPPRIVNSPRILGGLNRSASLRNTPSANKSIFADLESETSIMKEGFIPKRNVKKLVLKPKPAVNDSGNTSIPASSVLSADNQSMGEEMDGEDPPSLLPKDPANSVLSPEPPLRTTLASLKETQQPQPIRTPITRLKGRLELNESGTSANTSIMNDSLRGIGTGPGTPQERQPTPPPVHPAGLKLTRPDYYTVPELDDLGDLIANDGSCIVKDGFTVGRIGYGSVFWAGEMDVANLDLDNLVHFRHKEITVYPDETKKPPQGKELNRSAEVTLEGVWPRDKRTGEAIREPERLEGLGWRGKLESAASRMGAIFLDFRPHTGAWVFKVQHFSKYGLDDEPEPAPAPEKSESSPHSVQNLVQRSPLSKSDARDTTDMMEESRVVERTLGGRSLHQTKEMSDLFGSFSRYTSTSARAEPVMETEEDECKLSQLLTLSRSILGHERSVSAVQADGEYFESSRSRLAPTLPFRSLENALAQIPLDQSITDPETSTSLVDLALFKGRSFRVGWGPGHEMAELNPHQPFRTLLRSLCSSAPETTRVGRWLERQRVMSVREEPGSGEWASPHFAPPKDAEILALFRSLADEYPDDADQAETRLWTLLDSLWGNITPKNGLTEQVEQAQRKKRLINWLVSASAETTNAKADAVDGWERVFVMLCGGGVDAAVEAAMELKAPRLALLISAAANPATTRLARLQLKQWSFCQADLHLPAGYLEIVCLLAGSIVWQRSDGLKLNLAEGLDWKRAFLIHLRFGTSEGEGIGEAMAMYESGVRSGAWPAPEAFEGCLDASFQLIKLHLDYRSPLSGLLDPLAFSANPLSFHAPWALWSGLRSLGYAAFDEREEASLHSQFAHQLHHRLNLPTHALFVLQHIDDPLKRAWAVREMVARQPPLEKAEIEALGRDLGVPESWVYESKCLWVREEAAGKSEAEAAEAKCRETWYAIKAKDWNTAHRLFLRHVAPHSLLNDLPDTLRQFLTALEAHSEQIEGWTAGAQVYTDFLRLKDVLKQLETGDTSGGARAALVPELRSLVTRVPGVGGDSEVEALGRAEMGSVVAAVAEAVLSPSELSANSALLSSLAAAAPDDSSSKLTALIRILSTR